MPSSQPVSSQSTSSASKFDRSHDEIMKAAARLFRDKGYAASTLRDIAAAAGMKAGSLYYHFDSKEEILDAILDAGVRQVHDSVQAVIREGKEADRLAVVSAAARTHLTVLLARSEFTSVNMRIFGLLPAEIRARHLPLRRAYTRLWEKLLRDAQRAGRLRADIEIKPLRRFLLAALNSTVEWFDPEREDVDAVAERCTGLILRGIAPD